MCRHYGRRRRHPQEGRGCWALRELGAHGRHHFESRQSRVRFQVRKIIDPDVAKVVVNVEGRRREVRINEVPYGDAVELAAFQEWLQRPKLPVDG